MKAVNDGQYLSLLHLYATANAVHRPVVTIFPQIQNVIINRQVHNQTIRPIGFSEEQSKSVHNADTNTNKEMWHPNHFVSCPVIDDTRQSFEKVSSGQLPLKKLKISDNFKGELHGNEPPSTDFQSHERTEDQAEQSKNSNIETADKPNGKAADHQTYTVFHRSSKYDFGDILNGTVTLSALQNEKDLSCRK